jgi:predicted Zn-dependent peptidase
LKHSKEMRFETLELGPGIEYRYLTDDRWKSLSIDMFCKIPIEREIVTGIGMVPRLARRGTEDLPTLRDIAMRLEEMYGAGMGADATKIGPVQVIRFGINMPSPDYIDPLLLEGNGPSLGKAMSLVWDMATRPYLVNGAYPEDRFEMEREEHRRDILGIINNRARYAAMRLVEVISGDSPTGLPSWGVLDDLNKLNPRGTWVTWAGALVSCPISIYAVGQGVKELGEILQKTSLEFPFPRLVDGYRPRVDLKAPPAPEEIVHEEDFLPGEQTVLCMALHTEITEGHPDFPALIFFEGILGGFPHSKMFRNVREQEHLAYFADTSLNSWRGMVLAAAGVADEDRERCRDLVMEQVESMKKGDISDEEMDNTRTGLLRRYRSQSDSRGALIRRFLSQEIMGGPATEEELVSRIMKVTKDDVVRVAGMTRLTAVYALRAKGGNGHE